jgi:D-alanyl-D-alanine carboxypeptidase/D-alanyl-D-alanine-endopeptidase (penicillin-binding protein 4)
VPGEQFKLDDGCGLSKMNGISANAMTRVLAYDFASPNHDAFLHSLSIAGTDGTLEDRFKGSDLRGACSARAVCQQCQSRSADTLKANDGQWYAFSILMNGVAGSKGCRRKSSEQSMYTAPRKCRRSAEWGLIEG